MEFAFETRHLINFALALALGLLMGMEREVSKRVQHTAIGGIRTFPLSSVIGYISGLLSTQWGGMIAGAGIVAIAGIAIAAGVSGKTRGITTELALVLAGVVGVALGAGSTVPALLGGVVGTVLLSQKVQLHRWVETLTPSDVRAIVTFAVVAAVVLPVLPDVPLGPNGVLNPRRIWMVVALVTAINVVGYVATKYVHARQSIVLSAIVGSLVSSTAVTWLFATQSRANPRTVQFYGIGIALASSVMFIRVGFFAAIFHQAFLAQLFPVLLASAAAGLGALWLATRRVSSLSPEDNEPLPASPGNPAQLRSALAFGAFYAGIALLGAILNDAFGSRGLLALGAISGLADLDAITIAMSSGSAAGSVALAVAESVVVAAMLTNTLVKIGIAVLRGDRAVRRLVTISLGASALVLAVWFVRSFV